MIMAAWYLIVSMHSLNQADDRQWNPTVTTYTTPQACEEVAKQWWERYWGVYRNDGSFYLHPLSTLCQAETVGHKKYQWRIECNRAMACTRTTYEGYY